MILGGLPDSLYAAEVVVVAAIAALAAAVLLNLTLRTCYKESVCRKKSEQSAHFGRYGEKPQGKETVLSYGTEQVFDLLELVERLKVSFADSMEQKGIFLQMELKELDIPRMIGDQERLFHVLTELLTDAGEDPETKDVRVLFRQMYRNSDKVNLMIRIRKNHGGSEREVVRAEQLVQSIGGQLAISRTPEGGSDFGVFLTFKIQKGEQTDEG